MSTTERLARFIVETTYDAVPAAAIKTAKMAMLDCLGTTIAGSTEPAADIICEYIRELEAKPVATVIGRRLRTSATEAALANGIMAHALDYDDVTNPMSGHPSVPLLPAVLALGEQIGATGRDVLTAYAIGFETQAKIGRAVNPEHYRLGWHPTSTLGTMGAAAAASKLLGLNVEEVRMAIGLAASQAAGLRQNFGTMTKPFHPGNAARSGILAARLARKGFTADADILDGSLGFCQLFASEGHYDVERITTGLGERWELVVAGVGIKQYPCCAFTHPALDAMMGLIQEHNLAPGDVQAVDVAVNPMAPQILIHNNPHTGLEGKFSMQYCMSIALIDRQVGLSQFTDEKVNQPLARELIGKTRMAVNQNVPSGGPYPTVVTVTLRDGRTVSRSVNLAKGQPQDPLSDQQLVTKYLDCAAIALAPREAKTSLELMQQLEEVPDIRQLMSIVGA